MFSHRQIGNRQCTRRFLLGGVGWPSDESFARENTRCDSRRSKSRPPHPPGSNAYNTTLVTQTYCIIISQRNSSTRAMNAHLNPPSPPANHVNELRNFRKSDKEPLVEATPRRVRKRIVNLQLDYRTAYISEGARAGWMGLCSHVNVAPLISSLWTQCMYVCGWRFEKMNRPEEIIERTVDLGYIRTS